MKQSLTVVLQNSAANRLHVRYFTMNSLELGSQKLEKGFLQSIGDCFHVFKFQALSKHV